MIGEADLIAFVPTTDLDRAREFYEGTLGLIVESENPFACVLRSGPVMLRVTKVDDLNPQPFTVLGWSVVDIEDAARRLAAAGVAATRFDGMDQDDLGSGFRRTAAGCCGSVIQRETRSR